MDIQQIILFIFLFMGSAFFSGTELALMSIPEHKLNSLLKQKKLGSKSLRKIKENNDRLLIAILIGNNLVNVYTAALATTIAISFGEKSGLPQAQAVGIATGIVTFLLLLFGEIIPKSFATKNADRISLFVAPIYKILMLLLYPVIIFIEVIIKVFAGKQKIKKITDEEMESFIDMGKNYGALEDDEHEKIKNILDFGDILVEEIMIPRVNMDRLSSSVTVGKALEYYLSHTHSRIPVYEKSIDRINSFVTIRDIVSEDKGKKLNELNLKKVLKVPLSQPIDILLKTFQKLNRHLAIVVDEYGGVAGLITLEDILEEIFGEIRDETDKEIDQIKEIEKNYFVVEADVLIEYILIKYNLKLEDIGLDEKEFGGETLSYVITHILKRFPNDGEKMNFKIKTDIEKNKKLEFKIIGVLEGKIGSVEVKLK